MKDIIGEKEDYERPMLVNLNALGWEEAVGASCHSGGTAQGNCSTGSVPTNGSAASCTNGGSAGGGHCGAGSVVG